MTKSCPGATKILGGGFTYSVSTASRANRVSIDSYPSSATLGTAAVASIGTWALR